MDASIRDDPFSADPGWRERFFKPQPDGRLALIPVLPMGSAGVLSWRPKSTAWLAERPDDSPESTAQRAAFNWLGIEPAHAGELPPNRDRPFRKEAPNFPIDPAEPSKSFKNQVQEALPPQPLNIPRPPATPAQEGPRPTVLVPDPKSIAGFADLPQRVRLRDNAFWAGCDIDGLWCLRAAGRDSMVTTNGGVDWQKSPAEGISPILLADGQPRQVISAARTSDGVRTTTDLNSFAQAAVAARLPFEMAGYRVDDEVRAFRSSEIDRRLQSSVSDYLRLTGALGSLNFFGVQQDLGAPSSRASIGTYRLFALFGQGRLLSSVIQLGVSEPNRLSHQSQFNDLPTKANLRSLHFQPDQKIGWISSGWNDGNEEGALPAIFQTTDGGKVWERLSYRAHYAPWVWFIAMPGFTLAFVATGIAWRDYRDSRIDEFIATAGTSDAPIGWRDLDVLGLKPLALALSRFVRNTSTSPPLTIAITGPWGTGKSSLMNLVAEDLRQRGSSPVWFNAWHHQKEENILAALLENIRAQAIPPAWRLSGLGFRWRLLWGRVGKDFVPLALTGVVLFSIASVFDWKGFGTSLAALLTKYDLVGAGDVIKTASDRLDHVAFVGAGTLLVVLVKIYGTLSLKPSELMATLRGNSKLADFSAQLGFRYKFAKEFDAAGRALRTSTNPGLVIFIDDLDRCSQANLMEVLESINFLTTAGPCFIFLGMDEPKVIDIVAKQYADDKNKVSDQDKDRGRQYLKKLVNLTVPVPDVNVRNSVRLSSGDGRPADRTSPWPERIRAALRYVPDVGIPAMAVVLAIWLLASWATQLPAGGATPATTPEQTAAKADSGAPPAATDPASPSAPNAATLKDVKIPARTADELTLSRQMQPWLGGGIALLLIVMFSARRLTIAREDKVEDSKNFRAALAIWHPAVFAADPTPRGVKRHQNRLRLQAMRLRPVHDKPDLFDRWFKVKPDEGRALAISEPTLVALGAIVALCDDIPDWAVRSLPNAAASQQGPPAESIVAQCADSFKTSFSRDWPPSADTIEAFRALRRSL